MDETHVTTPRRNVSGACGPTCPPSTFPSLPPPAGTEDGRGRGGTRTEDERPHLGRSPKTEPQHPSPQVGVRNEERGVWWVPVGPGPRRCEPDRSRFRPPGGKVPERRCVLVGGDVPEEGRGDSGRPWSPTDPPRDSVWWTSDDGSRRTREDSGPSGVGSRTRRGCGGPQVHGARPRPRFEPYTRPKRNQDRSSIHVLCAWTRTGADSYCRLATKTTCKGRDSSIDGHSHKASLSHL